MKYTMRILSLALLAIFSMAFIIFAQDATPTPTPSGNGSTPVDTGALINIALGVSGIFSSVILTFIRNKFNLSSLAVYFLYLLSAAGIAFAVTYFQGGFSFGDIAASFAVVFTVGQAVYQSLIKGTTFGEIGNRGNPPSDTNEDTNFRG